MATSSSGGAKGKSIEISTFKKWGLCQTFGHTTEMRNERQMVISVWCKICAKNKSAVMQHPNCKGPIKTAVMRFIDGTNFVTKHTLTRHTISEGHRIAMSCEKDRPASERLPMSLEPRAKSAKVNINLTYKNVYLNCLPNVRMMYKWLYQIVYSLFARLHDHVVLA